MMIRKTKLRLMLLIVVAKYCILSSSAQSADLHKSKTLTFFGLDFSSAKLIGAEGFTDLKDIKEEKFESWNYLMANEPDKYNLARAFSKQQIFYSLSSINKINENINYMDLVDYNNPKKEKELNPLELQFHIDKLETGNQKGLGLLFVVDYFNKIKQKAQIYIVFFDIETRKIVFSTKEKGAPNGFGIRNYWAGAIKEVIENCEWSFKKWE